MKNTKSRTLGSTSSAFIDALLKKGKIVFSLEEAAAISKRNRSNAAKLLSDLVRRGILLRIKSGVYLILQIGQESTQLSNWPIITKALVGNKKYFISYYSAMRFHGMTTHSLLNIYITSPYRFKTKKVHNITYHFIYCKPQHFWGAHNFWVTKENQISISDIERTILDGLDRPDLCGGITEVIRGIWSKQNEINWERMREYIGNIRTKAILKRLGYCIELLNLNKKFVQELRDKISKSNDYILLDPNGPKKGKYNNKWFLKINIDSEELKGGVWQ